MRTSYYRPLMDTSEKLPQPHEDNALFNSVYLGFAGFMMMSQGFFLYMFIKNGYGLEYLLSLVAFVHAAIFMQIKRHIEAGKTLRPFEVMKGYIIITSAYYSIPFTIAATYWMMSTTIHPVGHLFLHNNKDFVIWVANLDLPGIRPALDLSNPKNILNIYFQTLAVCMCTLSIALGLLLLNFKIKDWRAIFKLPARNKGGFSEVIRLFVFSIFCLHFLSFYKTKYTYGYKLINSHEISPYFNGYTWALQIGSWALMASLFSFFLSGAIATAIDIFSINKKDT